MNDPERTAYIKYRLEKAMETLQVAELLVENKRWNSAVNRLYYAAYYAVSALLVQNTIPTKTHSGVKTQFFLHYVKTGIVEVRLGKTYADLFDMRQKGDYGDFFDFLEADMLAILGPSRELLERIFILLGDY